MNAEQAMPYIGKAYKLGAMGPDEFDCRGLLVHIQRKYFNHYVPDLPDGEEMRQLYEARLTSGIWELSDKPRHGDGVILRGGDQPHVGIYLEFNALEKGVMHALDGAGVVYTELHKLRSQGFSRVQYIRFHEGSNHV